VAAPSGRELYVGGDFDGAGPPLARMRTLARLSADGSLDTSWRPRVSGCPPASCIAGIVASGRSVYVGGRFTAVGGRSRAGLAAIDARTGRATAWDPEADAAATPVAVAGGAVYLTGDFSSAGGRKRRHLAAVDATSGRATAWSPRPDGPVSTVAPAGSLVYVGGAFTHVGGQPRGGLAALSAADGAATSWSPALPARPTRTMAVTPHGIFAAVGSSFGSFEAVRVDPVTAAVTGIGKADSVVSSGEMVYGSLTIEASGPELWRYDAAAQAFQTAGPDLRSFTAEGGGGSGPEQLAPSAGHVYAVGGIDDAGNLVTGPLAQLDPVTGAATATVVARASAR
jgi:hypothetical protein